MVMVYGDSGYDGMIMVSLVLVHGDGHVVIMMVSMVMVYGDGGYDGINGDGPW